MFFQTLIAAIIVGLAAVWVLKNAYDKMPPSQGDAPTCNGGCSGCSQKISNQNVSNRAGCGCSDIKGIRSFEKHHS